MHTLYVTTAIPFVNAAPHLGHALELVQADVIARHARSRGGSVFFLTGTDENAPKNAVAAASANVEVRSFVDRNALRFRALADALGVSYDDFVRTSADPRHRPAVERIWRTCRDRGDLYRARYAGWYCIGCEQFVDGACPEHDAPAQWVEEENWFFRLSRYADRLRELLASGALRIVPEERANEVRAFLAGEVRDISVSRSRDRALGWGIPVPDDAGQFVYVWFDALINYVSAAPAGWWSDGVRKRHVIGKGIVRFHAVVWPAILLSAGLPLPDELFVHDYVTVGGRKIGKSLGNVVDPFSLVERYGADALRWWLVREVPRVGEADFGEERLVHAANRDLANGIGNLVHRIAGLAPGVGGFEPGEGARDLVPRLRDDVDRAIASFDVRAASIALVDAVDEVNRFLEAEQPWKRRDDGRAAVAFATVAVRAIVAEAAPFVPAVAERAQRARFPVHERR